VALVVMPLLAFGLLEGALRLAGYGYDTAFFKKARIGGQDFLVNNDSFVLRFFPPQLTRLPGALRMEAQKPPNTCRIFVLGESSALGDPSPPYAAARYLQAMLSEKFPAEKFEVVNVSITAINSNVILPIARECARHEGDFWIIYMGNNEMVGPFGAASVFGAQAPPIWMVRFSLALQETRVGQWLMNAVRSLKAHSHPNSSWGGMEMFLGNQVPPDDPRKERVYRNFQENLRDILQAGLDSGAKVILNTVAVNLKDCSPFASIPLQGLKSANGQYASAQSLWNSGDFTAARQHFQQACDCDALPFRTDSRLNELIRQAARQEASSNLVLIDSANLMATNNQGGICGDETFWEHVHFNFGGNYRLARAWADAIGPLLPATNNNPWPSEDVCEQRLGLTDWNRLMTLSEVIRRRHQPPLSTQANNEEELAHLTNQFVTLGQQLTAPDAARARSLYLEDIQRNPDDYLLLFNFGDFLEATKDWKGGAQAWKQVQALLPQYYLGYFQEGRMLEREGELDDAESAFRHTVALYPRMALAWIELSNIHTSEGRLEAALQECDRALALEPEQAGLYVCKGTILSRMNRADAAIQQFHRAIQIRSDDPQAHLLLAQELSYAGQTTEAAREFREVLRLDPGNQTAGQGLAPGFK
jgi:tetratricopeptide (TPR) repeat protein